MSSLNFVIPEINIGGNGTPDLLFYKRGFNLNGSISIDWRDIILHGNTALTLVNAKADSLKYLKLFGGCEQRSRILPSGFTQVEYVTNTAGADVVPTPDNPMDIVCNNGVLKVSKNLFDKNQTYISAFVNANTGVLSEPAGGRQRSFVVDCLPNTTYTLSGMTAASGWGSFTSSTIGTTATSFTAGNGTITTGANDKYLIGMAYVESGTSYDYRNTLQIELGSTATSYMPYGQIYTDGTTETVEITGKNIFDKNSTWINYNTNADYIAMPVPNGTYTCSSNIPKQPGAANAWFDNQNQIFSTSQNPVADGLSRTVVVTEGMLYFAIRINATPNYKTLLLNGTYWVQIEQGSTATTYKPYYNGGTAIAENLFKVGTYQDVQSVIDGGVTRNIGIKVFDGSENWNVENQTRMIYSTTVVNPLKSSSNFGLTSSHYIPTTEFNASMPDNSIKLNTLGYVFIRMTGCANTNELKQFLATQYAQGKPVTILYPLATPTTETVTAQPMNIQAGTNIVQITQASMSNLELEVKYKAGVSVTITEIQNAQLDDNVEVTIS